MSHDSKLPPELRAFEQSLRTLMPGCLEKQRLQSTEVRRDLSSPSQSWLGYAACIGLGIAIGVIVSSIPESTPSTKPLASRVPHKLLRATQEPITRSTDEPSPGQSGDPRQVLVPRGIDADLVQEVSSSMLTASSMPSLLLEDDWFIEGDRRSVSKLIYDKADTVPQSVNSFKLDASSSLSPEWLSNDPIQHSNEG